MRKVRTENAVKILSAVIGRELATQVVVLRNSKERVKEFDAYRARLTLEVFQRASDPSLSAWEYVNRAANRACLTVEYLRACVEYDTETGIFLARLPSAARQEGDVLGSAGSSHGYLTISVAGQNYLAHRLAWFYCHGEWPEQIDHIDQDRRNNKLSNLRQCSNQENNWNKGPVARATLSGVTGVTWNRQKQRWVAKICHSGRSKTLGYFQEIEPAAQAYQAAVQEYRGHFLNGRAS